MLGSPRAFAAVALGAGLAVAGCGGTDFASRRGAAPAPDAARPAPVLVTRDAVLHANVVRSVTATKAERTARTSISVTLTGLDDTLATGAFDVAGSGVVDLVRGDADLALSIPLFDRLGGGGPIEHRIVGGVVYTKVPAGILAAAGLPASVRWLSLDPERAGGASRSALSQSQVDPAGQLAFVAATSDDVRTVGTDSVRGVPATHHAATIDLSGDARGGRRTAMLRAELTQLGWAFGAERLTVDAWLDRAGRARRVVVSIPVSARTGRRGLGPDAMLRIQADFYAFGTPVRVAAPPRAQVRPYTSFRVGAPNG